MELETVMEAESGMENSKPRHPKMMPFLFLTEMWERFGFYLVQGLLVLYMTQFYGFSDSLSYTISGIFTGLVYISPFIGGFLADKLLGFKTAVIWGGFFLLGGYTLLSLSSSTFLFYPALATIIVGSGLLKPNISSLLGSQYEYHDPARDSGFTLFYIGINAGAALSGLSGYMRNAFGYSVTFAMASVGMLIGIMTFIYGLKHIKHSQNIKAPTQRLKLQLISYCMLAILGLSFLLEMQVLAYWLLPCAGIILLVFLVVLTLQQSPEYRNRMIALNILILSSIVFWMLFLQIFNSANLYVDRLVNKNIFGMNLSTTVFYASESIFIILLGPLFARGYSLSDNGKNPSPIFKFVLGIFFAGCGFLILSLSTYFPGAQGIHPLWIFAAYFVITIGELFLSPIGLSAVTRLAPPKLIGMMMGIWFVAMGFGGLLAGMIANFASIPETAKSMTQKLAIYQHAFFDYACLAFFVAIALLFVNLAVSRNQD